MSTTATTAPERDRSFDIEALPLRRPGRWIWAIVLVLFAAWFTQALATNKNIDYSVVGTYLFKQDIVLGVGLIVYSLFTKYEWGPFGLIPMPVHLVFDIVASLFLALSPWLFGFSGEALNVWLPHVVVGVAVIVVVIFSQPQPSLATKSARL